MKKLLPIVLVLIVLAGIGWYLSKRQSGPPVTEKSGNALSGTALPTPGTTGGVVGSIKEAMGFGQTMQCTYAAGGTGDQAATSTVYVDGAKFKTETVASGSKMTVLSDGETQYFWNSGTKQGFSMSKACLNELQSLAPETQANTGGTSPKPTDYNAAFDTAQNVNCVKATGIDFTVPKDIVFVDQCAMMKQATQMMNQVKVTPPAGVNIPGY